MHIHPYPMIVSCLNPHNNSNDNPNLSETYGRFLKWGLPPKIIDIFLWHQPSSDQGIAHKNSTSRISPSSIHGDACGGDAGDRTMDLLRMPMRGDGLGLCGGVSLPETLRLGRPAVRRLSFGDVDEPWFGGFPKIGVPPVIIHFSWDFPPYKPSILGDPPFMETPICGITWETFQWNHGLMYSSSPTIISRSDIQWIGLREILKESHVEKWEKWWFLVQIFSWTNPLRCWWTMNYTDTVGGRNPAPPKGWSKSSE